MKLWVPPKDLNGNYKSYVMINGRLHPGRGQNLREQGLAHPGVIWEHADLGTPRPDFVRLHLWHGDRPIELQVSKAGNFGLIAPFESAMVEWILNLPSREARIQGRQEVSALVAAAFVTPFSGEEAHHLQYLCTWGDYTEADRESLKLLPWGKNVVFAYLAAHVPRDYSPPCDVNSLAYKEEFDRLVKLLTPPLRAGIFQGRRIHDFIQGRAAGREGPLETVSFPSQPEDTRVNARFCWEKIAAVGQQAFLSEDDLAQIRQKIVAELITEPIQTLIEENWQRQERDLQDLVLRSVCQTDLKRITDVLGPVAVDPAEQIRRHVTELLWNRRKSLYLNEGQCMLCGFPRNQFKIPQSIINALNGEQVPVCGVCLGDALLGGLGTKPREVAGRPPRPWVSTRQELIDLIRSLAEETGVLPEANLLHLLAKVTKERLLPTIRLLWRMPYPGRRKELAPDGWLALLAEAGLLAENSRSSIGTRCTANDGHPCRSLAEKYIDDWLFARAIPHDYEPAYPFDLEFNSNGKKADYRVGDTFIEYFGLMGQQHYAETAEIKKRLAARCKIELVEIYPDDLSEAGLARKLHSLLAKQ